MLPYRAFVLTTVASLLATVLLCLPARAQSENDFETSDWKSPSSHLRDDSLKTSDGPHLPSSWHRVSLWIAGSSLNGQLIGKVPDASIGMVGVRYQHRLAPSPEAPPGGVTYTYLVDVMPLVVLSVPRGRIPRTSGSDEIVFTEGTTVYGIGVTPIGLRIKYRTGTRLHPFIVGSTGGVFFVDSLPDDRGKQFHFTVDAGVGTKIGLTPATALTLSYRYHHLSNGFRGEINPGVDSHLFQIGVTVVP